MVGFWVVFFSGWEGRQWGGVCVAFTDYTLKIKCLVSSVLPDTV